MAWPYRLGMIKLVVTYGFEGKPSVNVHFVLQQTPVSPVPDAVLLSVANAAWTAWDDNWKTLANHGWAVDDITATDWSREGGHQIATTANLPIDGLGAGNALSTQVAGVVSQRTPRTGRSYRGRNYVPGLSVGTVIDNTMEAGLITDLGLLYAGLRAGLAVLDLWHVVYSLYSGGIARTTPDANPITHTIVNSRVDTQRRRLPT